MMKLRNFGKRLKMNEELEVMHKFTHLVLSAQLMNAHRSARPQVYCGCLDQIAPVNRVSSDCPEEGIRVSLLKWTLPIDTRTSNQRVNTLNVLPLTIAMKS